MATNPRWQMVGQDEWVFGVMVRGVVRTQLAVVYNDPDGEFTPDPDGEHDPEADGTWRWGSFVPGRPDGGWSLSFLAAVHAAEVAMGVARGNQPPEYGHDRRGK